MAVVSAKFSLLPLSSRGEKREVAQSTQTDMRPSKLPRASEITVVDPKPRQGQAPRRLPASAQVDVTIRKYTDVAADLWASFKIVSMEGSIGTS